MNEIEKAIAYLKDAAKIAEKNNLKQEVFEETKNIINTAIAALERQKNGGWIPFKAEYDDDFKMDMLQGEIPADEEDILVTDGESVWSDVFMRDGAECYLDSGCDLIVTVKAWQPLPKPFKETANERD